MSEMEIFHGYFGKSYEKLEPKDTDDFYGLEEKHKCHYVKVNGELFYFYRSSLDLDTYGFNVVLPETKDEQQILCYWYNGGAGIHEVVSEAIKNYLDSA